MRFQHFIGVALLSPGLITAARAATCESLAGLKLATTTISSAQTVPAGAFKLPSGRALPAPFSRV